MCDARSHSSCVGKKRNSDGVRRSHSMKPVKTGANKEVRKILIIGQTGNGKSSLGNILLGDKKFKVGHGMSHVTKTCTKESAKVPGTSGIEVFDTPDIENTGVDEIQTWKAMTEGAPDAILLAIRSDKKFTPEEVKKYKIIKETWGPDICDHLIVAFTFGDQREKDIRRDIAKAGPFLHQALTDAKDRSLVFNDKANRAEKKKQVRDLITMMDSMPRVPARVPSCSGGAEAPRRVRSPTIGKKRSVLIVGKTGSGKSTVGNILLNDRKFDAVPGMSTWTKTLREETGRFGSDVIQVIDTPDVLQSWMPSHQLKDEVQHWKTYSPDVILFTHNCNDRFNKNDQQAYERIKSEWGPSEFTEKLVLGFTFGDTQKGRDIRRDLANARHPLQSVLTDANERVVVFNDEANAAEKRKQAEALFLTMDKMPSAGTGASVTPPRYMQSTNIGLSAASSYNTRSYNTSSYTPKPTHEICILIIGQTGNGKSSLGNTILHKKVFFVGSGMSATTRKAAKDSALIEGLDIKVVDTPDIVNLEYNDMKCWSEVQQWKELAHPGPDVVALTIRCDIRYTKDEFRVYQELKRLWGSHDLPLVVAFTHGENKVSDIKRDMQKGSQELQQVLRDARDRYVVFSERASQGEKDACVRQLIEFARTIKPMSLGF